MTRNADTWGLFTETDLDDLSDRVDASWNTIDIAEHAGALWERRYGRHLRHSSHCKLTLHRICAKCALSRAAYRDFARRWFNG
jgi:hypothetical protein